jgi:hypothetical protein
VTTANRLEVLPDVPGALVAALTFHLRSSIRSMPLCLPPISDSGAWLLLGGSEPAAPPHVPESLFPPLEAFGHRPPECAAPPCAAGIRIPSHERASRRGEALAVSVTSW